MKSIHDAAQSAAQTLMEAAAAAKQYAEEWDALRQMSNALADRQLARAQALKELMGEAEKDAEIVLKKATEKAGSLLDIET